MDNDDVAEQLFGEYVAKQRARSGHARRRRKRIARNANANGIVTTSGSSTIRMGVGRTGSGRAGVRIVTQIEVGATLTQADGEVC